MGTVVQQAVCTAHIVVNGRVSNPAVFCTLCTCHYTAQAPQACSPLSPSGLRHSRLLHVSGLCTSAKCCVLGVGFCIWWDDSSWPLVMQGSEQLLLGYTHAHKHSWCGADRVACARLGNLGPVYATCAVLIRPIAVHCILLHG